MIADDALPHDRPCTALTGEPEDPAASAIFEQIRDGGREPGALHRALAVSPALLAAHYQLAMTLRHETGLDRALAELAILRTSQIEGGAYPFDRHTAHARNAGVTQTQIDTLGNWRESDAFDETERAVLTFVDGLGTRERVSDETHAMVRARLDPAQIVELTAIAGFYAGAARLACGLRLGQEDAEACLDGGDAS